MLEPDCARYTCAVHSFHPNCLALVMFKQCSYYVSLFRSVVCMFVVCVVWRAQGILFQLERMDACCSCVVLGICVHTPTYLDLLVTVVVVVIVVLPVVAVGTINA